MAIKTPPDWAVRYLQNARQLLGLGGEEWHFFLETTEAPGRKKNVDGLCRPDSVYQNATIEIIDSLEDDGRGQEVVYHEVMHVAHAEVDEVAARAFDWLPKKQRRLAHQLYRDAVERYTTRTSRALCANLKPPEVEHDQTE